MGLRWDRTFRSFAAASVTMRPSGDRCPRSPPQPSTRGFDQQVRRLRQRPRAPVVDFPQVTFLAPRGAGPAQDVGQVQGNCLPTPGLPQWSGNCTPSGARGSEVTGMRNSPPERHPGSSPQTTGHYALLIVRTVHWFNSKPAMRFNPCCLIRPDGTITQIWTVEMDGPSMTSR